MKITIVLITCLSLIGCGATSQPPTIPPPTGTTPPPQSPNVGVILAAEAVVAGCLVAETSVSPAAFSWLSSECAPTAASVLSVVEASGSLAKIQAAITALQASYAAIPSGTLNAHDQQVITASLVAFQLVLTTYEAATGQTLTTYMRSPITLAAFEVKKVVPHKLHYTPAETSQLEVLRKKAEAATKKKKK